MRFALLVSFLLCAAVVRAGEWPEALAAFSSVRPSSLERLAAGEIPVETNASMQLPRGVAAQACFYVAAPLERVAAFLPTWDARPHAELEILEHRFFHGGYEPVFEGLLVDGRRPAYRRHLELLKSPAEFRLSRSEAAQIPVQPTGESARVFWSAVLRHRWQAFATHGLQPAGDEAGPDIRGELQQLLAEEPRVAAHFAGLLAGTPLALPGPGEPVVFYLDVSPVNKVAAFSLGAVYRQGRQMADLQFYVSNGFLTALNLYELFPVTVQGRSGTLVWQGNFVSSAQLTGGFGIKRKLAARAIEGDTRESIRFLQQDAAR